ncbi:MAG: DoxX family protein [Nocardioides sp.]|nr:DoxX family protein [Nocardioides sp.]
MLTRTNDRLIRFEGAVHGWLVRHSISVLRISLGVVFLGFGVLKLFPAVSPAEDLVEATIEVMTAGIVPARAGLVVTALLECAIGFSLIAGRWVRLTVYLLAFELIGILSPLVLLPDRMFRGAGRQPTRSSTSRARAASLTAAAGPSAGTASPAAPASARTARSCGPGSRPS